MAKTLKTTPATPCCDACVTSALARASFDYTEPFVVYSNLRALPARARREFLDAIVANAEGDVIVMVSAPVPEELRSNASSAPATETESDVAAPSVEDLEAWFNDTDDDTDH